MGDIGIFVIFETKLDDSFPAIQFLICSYTSLQRLDRSVKGDDTLVFNVREDIPRKNILVHFVNNEGLFLEINLRKKMGLVVNLIILTMIISPHTLLDSRDKTADFLSHNYENFLMITKFNAEEADSSLKDFCDFYSFNHLLK